METIEDLIKKISTSDYDQETRYYEMYFQKNMSDHEDNMELTIFKMEYHLPSDQQAQRLQQLRPLQLP